MRYFIKAWFSFTQKIAYVIAASDCCSYKNSAIVRFRIKKPCYPGRGRGCSPIWPTWGHPTGKGMVLAPSALNRVYNFKQVCPNQGLDPS